MLQLLRPATPFIRPLMCLLTRSAVKLVQNTDRTNRNRSEADTDAENRVRTGDDPTHASAHYSERNDVCQYRVAHAFGPFHADANPKTQTDFTVVQRSLFSRS